MTRIWRRLIILGLTLVLFSGSAGAQAGEKDWQVPVLGKLRVPQDFIAVEFPDLKQVLDEQKARLEANGKLPIPNAKEKLNPERVDFAAYQLTMNDGQAYHLAWLVVIRDREPLDQNMAAYFDKPLNIEQRVAAIMTQDELSRNLDKMQYSDPSGFGVKVLGFDQFDFNNISGKQAYAGGARLLFNYKEFLFPVYMRGWIFNNGGHAAAALLVSTDSERAFWMPVLNSALLTLQPAPAKAVKK
jgi:hypothetical protein